uniref:Mitochondrial sodium/hydrogen exchanger 9B2 n=1 Tax=Lygus hesperus TaxID=30085 RepID=A0A0A9X084_LYGHE
MEPILFSLVGFEIDAKDLPMSSFEVGLTIAALFIGLLFRCLISAAVHYTSGFNNSEIVFLTVAGIPKATVQAAISPQLLDLLRGTEDEERSKALVFSGIISCFIFTSLSTLILHIFGKPLLRAVRKRVPPTENNNMS